MNAVKYGCSRIYEISKEVDDREAERQGSKQSLVRVHIEHSKQVNTAHCSYKHSDSSRVQLDVISVAL